MKMSPVISLSHKAMLMFCIAWTLCPCAFARQAGAAEDKDKPPASQVESAGTKAPLTPEEKKKADLRADTEKLYKLSQELKVEVEKSNKDTLSVSVIKKAQEIERLAKSIKERTRNQ
jgi:hypothetical protein